MTSASPNRGTVLVVLHNELLNGASVSVLRAVPLLEERGWRFAYWVPSPGPAFELLRHQGAEVYGEPRPIVSGLRALRQPPGMIRRMSRTPGYLRRFRRLVRSLSPSVVHANSLYSFAEALAARRSGFPTVLHVHDMLPASWKARPAQAIARRGVDVTVAVSESCAASFSRDGWSPRLVYEAAPIPPEPASIRSNPTPFVVGTVGVVSQRKGSDLFVEAARRVLGRSDGFEFRMIGAATDALEREWAVQVLDDARSVGVIHRDRADVLAELREWDLFVLPSRRDPFPIAMLEAMASGLPVIGARADGIAEQVTPDCGVLVDREDPHGLAEAITSMAQQPYEVRASMGAAARERVRRNFTLERQAEGLSQAYRAAIDEDRRPR